MIESFVVKFWLFDIFCGISKLCFCYTHFTVSNFYKNQILTKFIKEPKFCRSNYWLNAVICETKKQRDNVLNITNSKGIMTRPIWKLMCKLDMYKECLKGSLNNASYLEAHVVNLPSSVNFD